MHDIDDKLFAAARQFLKQRHGNEAWKGAAAIYTEAGEILLSTAPESVNDSVALCHETGAICEAYKRDEAITASLCISQDDKGDIHVLSPCGVCQERLFVYGENVRVAVADAQDSRKWQSKSLKDVQPYYWRKPFLEE